MIVGKGKNGCVLDPRMWFKSRGQGLVDPEPGTGGAPAEPGDNVISGADNVVNGVDNVVT